jgi:hypothetical protein
MIDGLRSTVGHRYFTHGNDYPDLCRCLELLDY